MLNSLSSFHHLHNLDQQIIVEKILFPDIGIPDDWKPQLDCANLEALYPNEIQLLIQAFHTSTGAYPAAIASLILTTTAHAIQAIFDVQRGELPPLPTSSMCLLIDESAYAKSAAIREATYEHTRFNRAQNSQDVHREFLAKHRIWKRKVRSLEKQLDKLDLKPNPEIDQQAIEAEYEKALLTEPIESNLAANFLLKDTSWSMMAKRFGEGAPSTAIVNDDASGVFSEMMKWAQNVCAVWSGADLVFDRTTCSAYQESPRLSVIMGLTCHDWVGAMEKHDVKFVRNGLGARTNAIHVPTLVKGLRPDAVPKPLSDSDRKSVERYNGLIKAALDRCETKFIANDLGRQVLTFSIAAAAQAELSERMVNELCKSGKFFSCVRERARRFYEHVMRHSAAIHTLLGRDGTEIALDVVLHAIAIERWFLMHYRELLGYLGVPQEERDAKSILKTMNHLLVVGKLPMTEAKLRQHVTTRDGFRYDQSRFDAALKLLRGAGIVVTSWYGGTAGVTLSEGYLKQRHIETERIFAFPEK